MKLARLMALALCAGAVGFSAGTSPLDAQTPVTVRVGSAPLDSNGPLYYAEDLGYFKDVGITIEFATGLNNAAASLAALSGGSIDISAGAVTSIAAAHDAGLNVKLIAPSQMSDPGSPSEVLVLRKDSTVKGGADLNGKTVGIIGVKSLMQVAAMTWVDHHGGDAKTVKFVELPVPQMCAALDGGRIDAAVMLEPFGTACTNARTILTVEDGIAPRFLTTAFVSTDDYLKNNRDVATRFAAAITKAGAWANTHPRESAAILVKYTHLDPAIVANMRRARYGTELAPTLIQPVIDASARYGTIARGFPASDLIWAR